MSGAKTLDAVDTGDTQAKVSDVKVTGNTDIWCLVCKSSSKEQGWMKSTKAMAVPNGLLVLVTTQQGDNVAEALAFVPGAALERLEDGSHRITSVR